jgi:para-aminobenzoate synthetase component I
MPAVHGLICEVLDLKYPLWRYAKALRERQYAVLLDSQRAADGAGTLQGRYSYLAWDPFALFEVHGDPLATGTADKARTFGASASRGARIRELTARNWDAAGNMYFARSREQGGDPLIALQEFIAQYTLTQDWRRQCPLPFAAGALGYFAYEFGELLEFTGSAQQPGLGLPLASFGLYDSVIGVDHFDNRAYLTHLLRGTTFESARAGATARALRIREFLRAFSLDPTRAGEPSPVVRAAPMSLRETILPGMIAPNPTAAPEVVSAPPHVEVREQYTKKVATLRELIAAGTLFEACLTQRYCSEVRIDAFELYRYLRQSAPNPFAAFLVLPRATVCCGSPERFLHASEHGDAESRPIKGTRPRGADAGADAAMHADLTHSEKDRAENIMIVDLVRSDFARVCVAGSVHVAGLCDIESQPNVHHMVSTIRGKLAAGNSSIDLLRACFPGGSMTGAPKVEAITQLRRLEAFERGIYSGSIGYIDVNFALNLNIVIRSAIVQDTRVYFHAGGAVVSDSDPASEYAEVETKLRPMRAAIARCAAGPI